MVTEAMTESLWYLILIWLVLVIAIRPFGTHFWTSGKISLQIKMRWLCSVALASIPCLKQSLSSFNQIRFRGWPSPKRTVTFFGLMMANHLLTRIEPTRTSSMRNMIYFLRFCKAVRSRWKRLLPILSRRISSKRNPQLPSIFNMINLTLLGKLCKLKKFY